MATWLSGQLGHAADAHASVDLIAACAGLPYGLSEAVRLLQEVDRPVLLVCGEKFSDKIGTVRPSRMIFGDGASAFVIAPAPEGEDGDIDLLQTYAGGPVSQVNSIIWPNAAFDNNITVFGPEVKTLAGRYLAQMIDELAVAAGHHRQGRDRVGHRRTGGAAPGEQDDGDRAGGEGRAVRRPALLQHRDDGQHLVGEHPDRDRRRRGGRGSSTGRCGSSRRASAPAPSAGYSVMRIDPAIVVPSETGDDVPELARDATLYDGEVPHGSDDIAIAFGG